MCTAIARMLPARRVSVLYIVRWYSSVSASGRGAMRNGRTMRTAHDHEHWIRIYLSENWIPRRRNNVAQASPGFIHTSRSTLRDNNHDNDDSNDDDNNSDNNNCNNVLGPCGIGFASVAACTAATSCELYIIILLRTRGTRLFHCRSYGHKPEIHANWKTRP